MAKEYMDAYNMDINMMSSVDLLTQMTDYVEILESFPNETAVNSIYWHTDSHSDPITSKIEFYKQLNSNTLKIKDNPDGVKKRDLDKDKLQNVNVRSQLADHQNVVTSSGDKYGKVERKGEMVGVSTKTTTRTWQSKTDDDVNADGEWVIESTTETAQEEVARLKKIQEDEPDLKSTYGLQDMPARFILWWVEKFNTSHHIVKNSLREALGDENEYFVNFSESVGQLRNFIDGYDSSTLPVWDLNTDMYGDQYSIPSITPSVGSYCTKIQSKAFTSMLSRQTNKVYRSNLVGLMDDASRDTIIPGPIAHFNISIPAHGNNLVSDFQHAARIHGCVGDITQSIQEHLKGMFGVLELLRTRVNEKRNLKAKKILINVEGFTTAVDRLKHRISEYTKVNQTTDTKFGKKMYYNSNRTNAQKLGGVEDAQAS